MSTGKKEIRYLNKDFSGFRNQLVDFTKQYFPETYNDFNETSPGMMFVEMASMVGDVLSFYTDHALRENMLQYAQEKDNVIKIARALGYQAKASVAATVELDVFCIVPATGTGVNSEPDMRYTPTIAAGMECSAESDPTQTFTTLHEVDFSYTGSSTQAEDSTEVTVFSIDDVSGEPTNYLFKKKVRAIGGRRETQTFTIGSAEKFKTIKINSDKVVHIESCTDSDNNEWYEVPYLAQDTVFEEIRNNEQSAPNESGNSNTVPYLLKLKKTARRFTTYIDSGSYTYLQFGSGVSNGPDEILVPNPATLGNVLNVGATQDLDGSFDPANIMFTKAYGQAPSNTTLTVSYIDGGGLASNVVSGDINNIVNKTTTQYRDGLDEALADAVLDSIAVSNPNPASGGKESDSIEDIRYNAMGAYASQNRAVTMEDYIARVYAMPAKYGGVAKAYIAQSDILANEAENPLALDLYVLSYDLNKNFTHTTDTAKKNIQTYLSQYRMLTDAINIRNGFIVNIGVDFDIVPRQNQNGNEVILRCIDRLKQYFDPENWQIQQPILLTELQNVLDQVPGVQMVQKLEIINKISTSNGYSGINYDIKAATEKNVIYPSQTPMIWEVKYPDQDLRGRIVGI